MRYLVRQMRHIVQQLQINKRNSFYLFHFISFHLFSSTTDVEADVVKDEHSFGDLQDGLGLISSRVYRFKDGQAPLLSRHIFGNFFMSLSVKWFSQRQVQLVTLKSSLPSSLFMRLHQ